MQNKVETLPEHSTLKIDLHEAVFALAESLSLVGVDEHQHGERVAYTASACARELGWEKSQIDDLFYAALLHDCGVSSSKVHKKLIAEMEWEGAELHCIIGEYYLKTFTPLSHLAPLVRYHHTRWSTLQEVGVPDNIALASNLLYLSDRVDAISAQLQQSNDLTPPTIAAETRKRIKQAAGEIFAPSLVEAFLKTSDNDAFWLTQEPLHLVEYLAAQERAVKPVLTQYSDIKKLARIFSHIVDAKSSYTYDHSIGVARVASELATLLGLPQPRIDLIELAGLLHDLGKLGIPDEILDKKTPLSEAETAIMHSHSYETYRILNRIKGFEQIAEWAGNHHETLLGNGYPFQRTADELSIETRIITVADIFQALAQDRPYRNALSAEEILAKLNQLCEDGAIDCKVVQVVNSNIDSIWQAATEGDQEWPPNL